MDLRRVVEDAGFLAKANKPSFLRFLGNLPQAPGLLANPHPDVMRLQGDILSEVPFCLIMPDGSAKSRKINAAILNNTCDLQPARSDVINIVPVLSYSNFKADVLAERGISSGKDYLYSVERNKVDEIFYIDNAPALADGAVILLNQICTLTFENYERALERGGRLASFTQNGFYYFLLKLTYFLARIESDEASRETLD